LGSAVVSRLLEHGRHEVLGWCGSSGDRVGGIGWRRVELADGAQVETALRRGGPAAGIHAGGRGSGGEGVRGPRRGWEGEVGGARGGGMVSTSTDLVFDGARSWYREDDDPRPVLAYGRTKREAEAHVIAIEGGLVARLSLLYGPHPSGRPGFFDLALEALRR